MAKWELAVNVSDNPDLSSGHKRSKEGDIITVVEYPHQWGKKEIDGHLLFIIVDGLTRDEAHELKEIDFIDDINNKTRTIVNKRKFVFRFDELKKAYTQIDLDKIKDKENPYQPFKDNDIVIDVKDLKNLVWDKKEQKGYKE